MIDAATVTEETTPNGLTRLTIQNRAAKAMLYTQGAHLTSFEPAGGSDLLWVSGAEDYQSGKAIRGGIPICWPWFGTHPSQPDAPAHGLVRTREWGWTVVSEAADRTQLRLTVDTQGDQASFPYRARLTLTVDIGAELTLTLTTQNLDTTAFTLSQALHTYLPVDNINNARINALAGSPYLDKLTGERALWPDTFRIDREIDRIVVDNDAPVSLTDGSERVVRLARRGSRSLVVWNPWVEKSLTLSNFEDDDYQRMICLESANVDQDTRTLQSGDQHSLGMTLTDTSEPAS